jgi:hypothetical protein
MYPSKISLDKEMRTEKEKERNARNKRKQNKKARKNKNYGGRHINTNETK